MYGKLIEPILKEKEVATIIFVPEDFLNAISFESLMNKNGKFIVQNYIVSYAYSLKIWDFFTTKANSK